MPARESQRSRGSLRANRVVRSIGLDVRTWRTAAGLTQREVARAAGVSRSFLCRLELGRSHDVKVGAVGVVFAVLGHELSVKGYPVGTPIRDAGQARLLAQLRQRVSQVYRWTSEAPMSIPGDLRAWDVRLDGPTSIGVEAETRLSDLQELQRRVSLKQRDSGVSRLLLVVAGTHHNRDVIRRSMPVLRQMFPLDTRECLYALAAGRDPGGNGMVLL